MPSRWLTNRWTIHRSQHAIAKHRRLFKIDRPSNHLDDGVRQLHAPGQIHVVEDERVAVGRDRDVRLHRGIANLNRGRVFVAVGMDVHTKGVSLDVETVHEEGV